MYRICDCFTFTRSPIAIQFDDNEQNKKETRTHKIANALAILVESIKFNWFLMNESRKKNHKIKHEQEQQSAFQSYMNCELVV